MEIPQKRKKQTHHGHAVKRLRQTLGMKQEVLADLVGVCQQTISTYEKKKKIEDEMLEKFALALGVTVPLLKDLEEDPVTIIFENNNTIENNTGNASIGNYIQGDSNTYYHNPVDKIVELFEKLLETEREKIALLQQLLKEKSEQ